MSGANMHEVQM